MEILIYRFPFLSVIALLFISCSSTDVQSLEGRNSVVAGHGGTRKVIDGGSYFTTTKRRAAYIFYRHGAQIGAAAEEAYRVVGGDPFSPHIL